MQISTSGMLNLPKIPGLTFRSFQGESDYPGMAAVLTASETADHMDRTVTAEDLAQAYSLVHNCDPYHDVIIAEVEGETVGYIRGWWWDERPLGYTYIHNAFLRPEWRHQGIGTAMLERMEKRLGEVARNHPADVPKIIQVNATQFQVHAATLFERSGYQAVRYFYQMVRPNLEEIPEDPLPAGLEVRKAAPEQYHVIWELNKEISREEWGVGDWTEADYQEWLKRPEFQPELWQIAWDIRTNLPVGHVLTYIKHDENKQFNRKRGYTEGIGVSPAWRRKGLARALINRSLRAQKAVGMNESALVVDTDNASGAGRLYESCGFQVVKRDTAYRKPLVVP